MVSRSLDFIEDPNRRMATFKKRSKSLKKSIFELSTLCDVPACIVIYNPEGKDGKHYKVWPQERDKFRHVLDLYKKTGGGGRACSSSGEPKKESKLQAEKTAIKTEPNCCSKDEARTGGSLEERLKKLSADQALSVMAVVDKKIREIQSRVDGKISQNMMEEDVDHVKVDDADAGALVVVQGMDANQNQINNSNFEVAANVNFSDHYNNVHVAAADVQVLSAVVRKDSIFEVADEYFDFGSASAANVTINDYNSNFNSYADDPVPVLPEVMRKDGVFNVAGEYFDFGAFDDFGACSSLTLPPLPQQPQIYTSSSYHHDMVYNESAWFNSSSDGGREPSLWESILCEDLPMPTMMMLPDTLICCNNQ